MPDEARDDPVNREEEPTFVIGRELADATAEEARHRLRDEEPSPLAGVAYDGSRGEADLFRFVASSVDDIIGQFVERCAGLDAHERGRVRSALTLDDFYKLLTFASRCALRTLRTNDPATGQAGMRGLSLIDLRRVDPRDATAGVALVSYAVGRTGGDASANLAAAASVAEPEMARVFVRFIRRPVVSLSEWGFREIQTDAGVILVWDKGSPFEAAVDLVSIARAIGSLIEADVWKVSYLSVGADLPYLWLRGRNRRKVEHALASLRGCVTVSASLSPRESPVASAQQFTTFIAEAAATQDARVLAEAASAASGAGHVGLGVACGPVCAVMVSRSFVKGGRVVRA